MKKRIFEKDMMLTDAISKYEKIDLIQIIMKLEDEIEVLNEEIRWLEMIRSQYAKITNSAIS